MSVQASINCTYADGRTLEELSRLIEKRAAATGETAKDACVAIAINTLTALKADTRQYAGRALKPERIGFVIEERPDVYVGFDYATKKRVLRFAPPPRGRKVGHRPDNKVIWLVLPSDKMAQMRVFQVWYPDHIRERYRFQPHGRVFVAMSRASVEKWLETKFTKLAQRYRGLARYAMMKCQTQLSTRVSVNLRTGPKATAVGDMAARVTVRDGAKTYGVTVSDALNYATKALKGGNRAVDSAMKKAANKVAGFITHLHHQKGDFIHDIKTPFPEVKRRRSA